MTTAAERRAARKKLRAQAEGKVEEAAKPIQEMKPEEAAPSPVRSRDTITVACKIPNGIIIQNHELIDGFEPVFGGGSRPIKTSRPIGNPIKINGSSRPLGSDPDAKRVIGGYALTYNVPKAEFERWLKDNEQLDMVKNKLIFAHVDPARVADEAKEFKSLRSGLEPLNTESRNPDKTYVDPRMPKNIKRFNPDDDSTDIRGAA